MASTAEVAVVSKDDLANNCGTRNISELKPRKRANRGNAPKFLFSYPIVTGRGYQDSAWRNRLTAVAMLPYFLLVLPLFSGWLLGVNTATTLCAAIRSTPFPRRWTRSWRATSRIHERRMGPRGG